MNRRRLTLPAMLIVGVVACTFTTASGAIQAPLADRVPDDAMVYIGWRGVDSAGNYEGSHFRGFVESWDLPGAIHDQLVPMIRREEGDEAGEAMSHVVEIARIMFHRPWCFYVGQVDATKLKEGPRAPIAIVCDAGDKAEQLEDMITSLIAMGDVPADAVRVIRHGNTVALLGKHTPAEAVARLGIADAEKVAAPLSQNKRFTDALTGKIEQPMGAIYVDLAAAIRTIDQAIKQQEPEEHGKFVAIVEALGVDRLGRFVWTGGIDGQDWREAAWLESPVPHRGLMSLFAGGALDHKTLAIAPRTSTWMTASRLDLGKIMPIVRDVVDRVAEEDDKAEFEKGLAEVKKEVGIDLEKDLVDAFGDQWLVYGDFSAAGPLGMNMMFVNIVRDGNRLQQSLGMLASKINEQMAGSGGPMTFEIKSSPVANTTVSYLNFPMISPAWAVYKDRFYLSLSPAAVRTRIGFDQVQVAPITEADDFKMMRQKIGREAVTSISYADLRQTAPQIIGQIAMYAQLMAMQIPAQGDGEPRPPFDPMRFIPAMEKLMPHLGPTMSASWLDDTGLRSETSTPFPGADMFSPSGGSSTTVIAGGALGAGILLPSLSRAREIADRTVCSANLSGMYKAAYTYSITHKDNFPPNLATMVQNGSMGVKSIGCDNDANFDIDTFPKTPLDDPEVAAWIDEHASYVYLGGTKTANIKPDDIFAYEKIGLHGDEGINICFGDGHVEFVNLDEAMQLLKKAGIENPVHGEQGNARGLGATNK